MGAVNTRPHPSTLASRAAALRSTPSTLTQLLESAQADRDAFGVEQAYARIEQIAAVAIATLELREKAGQIRPAAAPGPILRRIDSSRPLRAVSRDAGRDERRARRDLYPVSSTVTVLHGDGNAPA